MAKATLSIDIISNNIQQDLSDFCEYHGYKDENVPKVAYAKAVIARFVKDSIKDKRFQRAQQALLESEVDDITVE